MAMLVAAQAVGVRCEVASLDHGLRAEAAAEVALVRAHCATHRIPFHTRNLGLAAGPGVEERAREARYGALRELAAQRGLRWIATAHTASDQAETVLMRLCRGASTRGAVGIHPVRADGVFRPLLFAERTDTVAYLAARGVAFVSDPMNEDRAFLRTRVRHEVMPVLEGVVGPHVTARLARFAAFLSEDDAALSAEAATALERVRLGAELDLFAVRALSPPVQRRVLVSWLLERGISLDAHHLDDVRQALTEERSATLPHDRVLTTEGARLRVEPAPPRLHGSSSGDDGRARK